MWSQELPKSLQKSAIDEEKFYEQNLYYPGERKYRSANIAKEAAKKSSSSSSGLSDAEVLAALYGGGAATTGRQSAGAVATTAPAATADTVVTPSTTTTYTPSATTVATTPSTTTTAPATSTTAYTPSAAQATTAPQTTTVASDEDKKSLKNRLSNVGTTVGATATNVALGAADTVDNVLSGKLRQGIVNLANTIEQKSYEKMADIFKDNKKISQAYTAGAAESESNAIEAANKILSTESIYADTALGDKVDSMRDSLPEKMAELNDAGQYIAQLGYSVGQQLPAMAVGGAVGAAARGLATAASAAISAEAGMAVQAAAQTAQSASSLSVMWNNVYTNSYRETAQVMGQQGITDVAEYNSVAAKRAALQAGVEIATEVVVGGTPGFGPGVLDDFVKPGIVKVAGKLEAGTAFPKLLASVAKSDTAKATVATVLGRTGKFLGSKGAQLAYDIIGEGIEEMVSEGLNPIIERKTIDPYAPNATFGDYFKAGLGGVLISSLFHTGAIVRNFSANGGKLDIKTNEKNEGVVTVTKPDGTTKEHNIGKMSDKDAKTVKDINASKNATQEQKAEEATAAYTPTVRTLSSIAQQMSNLTDEQKSIATTYLMMKKWLSEGILTNEEASKVTGIKTDLDFTKEKANNIQTMPSKTIPDWTPEMTWDDIQAFCDNLCVPAAQTYQNFINARSGLSEDVRAIVKKMGHTYVTYDAEGNGKFNSVLDYLRDQKGIDTSKLSVEELDTTCKKYAEDFVKYTESLQSQIKTVAQPFIKALNNIGINTSFVDTHDSAGEPSNGDSRPYPRNSKYKNPKVGAIRLNPRNIWNGNAARIVLSHEFVHQAQRFSETSKADIKAVTDSITQSLGLPAEAIKKNLIENNNYTEDRVDTEYQARILSLLMSDANLLEAAAKKNPTFFKGFADYIRSTIVGDTSTLLNKQKAQEAAKVDSAVNGTLKQKTEAKRTPGTKSKSATKSTTQSVSEEVIPPKSESTTNKQDDVILSKEESKKLDAETKKAEAKAKIEAEKKAAEISKEEMEAELGSLYDELMQSDDNGTMGFNNPRLEEDFDFAAAALDEAEEDNGPIPTKAQFKKTDVNGKKKKAKVKERKSKDESPVTQWKNKKQPSDEIKKTVLAAIIKDMQEAQVISGETLDSKEFKAEAIRRSMDIPYLRSLTEAVVPENYQGYQLSDITLLTNIRPPEGNESFKAFFEKQVPRDADGKPIKSKKLSETLLSGAKLTRSIVEAYLPYVMKQRNATAPSVNQHVSGAAARAEATNSVRLPGVDNVVLHYQKTFVNGKEMTGVVAESTKVRNSKEGGVVPETIKPASAQGKTLRGLGFRYLPRSGKWVYSKANAAEIWDAAVSGNTDAFYNAENFYTVGREYRKEIESLAKYPYKPVVQSASATKDYLGIIGSEGISISYMGDEYGGKAVIQYPKGKKYLSKDAKAALSYQGFKPDKELEAAGAGIWYTQPWTSDLWQDSGLDPYVTPEILMANNAQSYSEAGITEDSKGTVVELNLKGVKGGDEYYALGYIDEQGILRLEDDTEAPSGTKYRINANAPIGVYIQGYAADPKTLYNAMLGRARNKDFEAAHRNRPYSIDELLEAALAEEFGNEEYLDPEDEAFVDYTLNAEAPGRANEEAAQLERDLVFGGNFGELDDTDAQSIINETAASYYAEQQPETIDGYQAYVPMTSSVLINNGIAYHDTDNNKLILLVPSDIVAKFTSDDKSILRRNGFTVLKDSKGITLYESKYADARWKGMGLPTDNSVKGQEPNANPRNSTMKEDAAKERLRRDQAAGRKDAEGNWTGGIVLKGTVDKTTGKIKYENSKVDYTDVFFPETTGAVNEEASTPKVSTKKPYKTKNTIKAKNNADSAIDVFTSKQFEDIDADTKARRKLTSAVSEAVDFIEDTSITTNDYKLLNDIRMMFMTAPSEWLREKINNDINTNESTAYVAEQVKEMYKDYQELTRSQSASSIQDTLGTRLTNAQADTLSQTGAVDDQGRVRVMTVPSETIDEQTDLIRRVGLWGDAYYLKNATSDSEDGTLVYPNITNPIYIGSNPTLLLPGDVKTLIDTAQNYFSALYNYYGIGTSEKVSLPPSAYKGNNYLGVLIQELAQSVISDNDSSYFTPGTIAAGLAQRLGYDGIITDDGAVVFDKSSMIGVDDFEAMGFNSSANDDFDFAGGESTEEFNEYVNSAKTEGRNSETAKTDDADENKNIRRVIKRLSEEPTPEPIRTEYAEAIDEEALGEYEVLTDAEAIKKARERIGNSSITEAFNEWQVLLETGNLFNNVKTIKNDVVYSLILHEKLARLIKANFKAGKDYSNLMDADQTIMSELAANETGMGQGIQAMQLLNKLSPAYKARVVDRTVAAVNRTLGNKATPVKVSEELKKAYTDAVAKGDDAGILVAEQAIADAIASQMPKNFRTWQRNFRYLAMLLNPTTHLANMMSNNLNKLNVIAKDAVAGLGEDVFLSKAEQGTRTKTLLKWLKVDPELNKFVNDYVTKPKILGALTAQGKYAEAAKKHPEFSSMMQKVYEAYNPFIFEGTNKLSKVNSGFLEKEDLGALTMNYKLAFKQYCKANGITVDQLNNAENSKLLNQAHQYAVAEAQEATYRNFNAAAAMLSELEGKLQRKSGVGAAIGEIALSTTVPFKSVPANFLARGFEYSPFGLMSTINQIGQAIKVAKSETSTTTDEAAAWARVLNSAGKSLTGTTVFVLGMLLSQMGIIKASGDDKDKAEYYDQAQGNQQYSITLPGGGTLTIDRILPPTSVALFAGVELQSYFDKRAEAGEDTLTGVEVFNGLKDAFSGMADPIVEMSFLQSISNTLDAIKYDGIKGLPGVMALNYARQFEPTVVGKFTNIANPTVRSTRAGKDSESTYIGGQGTEQAMRKLANNLPILNRVNAQAYDVWGRARTSTSAANAVSTFLYPGYYQADMTTPVDEMINSLYATTKDAAVIPSTPEMSFSFDTHEYNLTNSEYASYSEIVGTTQYNAISQMMSSDLFDTLTDDEKAKLCSNIYTYARQVGKSNALTAREIAYDAKDISTDLMKAQIANALGISTGEYFIIKYKLNQMTAKNSAGETVVGLKKSRQIAYCQAIGLSADQAGYIFGVEY